MYIQRERRDASDDEWQFAFSMNASRMLIANISNWSYWATSPIYGTLYLLDCTLSIKFLLKSSGNVWCRLLDDNKELFVPELHEVIKPHPQFMLFATQNPAGAYAGRKQMSRAFRSRFLELHVGEIPDGELAHILHERCAIAPSHADKLIAVMKTLQRSRQVLPFQSCFTCLAKAQAPFQPSLIFRQCFHCSSAEAAAVDLLDFFFEDSQQEWTGMHCKLVFQGAEQSQEMLNSSDMHGFGWIERVSLLPFHEPLRSYSSKARVGRMSFSEFLTFV